MITVEKMNIAGIPVLHIARDADKNKKTPFVLFVHGFTSAKEHNLHYAYLLAERGIRVALPDALHHGERSGKLQGTELNMQFWSIVINEIKELDLIKNHFEKNGLIDPENIGVAGTSMGGIVTLGALTQYEWIKAAASLMGSPYYEQFSRQQIQYVQKMGMKVPLTDEELEKHFLSLQEYDLSLHTEKLASRPLLFWHGKKDNVVPFDPTYTFFKEIQSAYETKPEYLKFIADTNADHKVSREGLIATVDWFADFLCASKSV
ncbi:prolyl oligopeptidase family serine peptidase [Metabacillus sp. JX24]|uniref:prolyl oligopeptidase family serine peptidase n=1 Tax=Metabacillus sp. JX24 TaxID=3240759 RepID=UPI0035108C4F